MTHLDFRFRRSLEWALVLPLAMPAYVMAYAYADLLQFAGPVQTALREATGWTRRDYWFPDVRSLGGAVVVLSCVLYPYVYLLVAHRLPRARRDPARRRPGARPDAVAQLPARLAADGPAGDRRRRGAGPDGDAGRLRHRLLLRRADLHHRHLSRLVLARRPHRRGAALDGPARLRRHRARRRSGCRAAARASPRRGRRAAPPPASGWPAGAPRSRSPPARCRSRSASSCRRCALLRLALGPGRPAVRPALPAPGAATASCSRR